MLFALVGPDRISDLTPGAFLRIPVEALLGVGLILVLPPNARPFATALAGVALGLISVLKILDISFYAIVDRPFDPILDRSYFGNALDFLSQSFGRAGAIGAAIVATLAAAGLLVAVVLSVRRLADAAVRHRRTAIRAVSVLGVVWIACAVLGVPVAARSAAALIYDRVQQVRTSLHDAEEFAAEAAVDAFRDTASDRLLTALRGKDVVLAFVESYGRSAIEDPELGAQVGAVLDDGDRQLRAAGFASRSAFLTSSTVGGRSWLAHSTLQSGLWIDNQQRFRTLVSSNRLTLTSAFRRAGWRTVAVMPATSGSWPEGAFYGYDKVYGTEDLGYRGPSFGFGIMPDQYALSAFQHLERAAPARGPLMAQIVLVSSHAPWTSIPKLVDWQDVGDGSGLGHVADGDATDVRTQYRRSIEYTLSSLVGYVRTYGDDNLVLLVVGDHQPTPIITGEGASHDVPIAIATRDRAVLDRIAGWGWQDGLKPGPRSPVWRMNTFRDQFLTAFGS